MKDIRLILVIIFLLISNLKTFSTAQVPDLMVIDKDTFFMHTNPLEVYLDSVGDRNLPDFVGSVSTACWRGYQAVWRVDNDSLFLEKIRSCHREEGDVDANLKKMFGDKFINDRVYVDWFTGLIVLPHGNLKEYVHMGYGSTYDKYLLLEIKRGKFTKKLEFNDKEYKNFRAKQFEIFKKTPEYRKTVEDLKKEGFGDQNFIDSFLRDFIVNYTTRILEE